MKKIAYIFIIIVASFTSCTEEYSLEDNGFTLQEVPGYVAFSVAGASTTMPPTEASEADGTVALNVEIPTTSPFDVTVNYTFGGTAVYGEDFTVDGATSAGGSIVIPRSTDINLDGLPDNADINIQLLTDGVADGTKTLEVTLTSASNAEGDIAVGRGGTDLLRTATVVIADVD